jgi:hypothetical protein
MTDMSITRILAGALAGATLSAASLHAQQPSASTGAFGMAGNYTAAARNYDAVAWNPANLALPGNSVASFNLFALGGVTGLGPVDLPMIAKFNGTTIPASTKEEWLTLIAGKGFEQGGLDGGASLFAISIKNVAFQLGSSGYSRANLNEDAAEVLLYGNAGRTGTVRNYAFAGSSASGAAFTTAAASIGFPLPITLTSAPDEIITLGVTGKYVMGNAYANAQDAGSQVTGSNVAISFPAIYGDEFDLGRGVGMDVGLAWHAGALTAGITAQNVFNTFAWDTTKLKARLGTASFNGTTSTSDFSDTTYSLAPAAMREQVAADKFTPTIAGGLAWQAANSLLLTADARAQTGDGIKLGPRSQVGVGLEFTGVGFFPIRLGAAKIPDGYQAGAGFGLRLGENHIGVSAMLRDRGLGRETGAMLNLLAFY